MPAVENPYLLSSNRVPLTFADAMLFAQFQRELADVLIAQNERDAVVLQYGDAVNGWENDPNLALTAWSQKSPAKFAVFSIQGLQQAMNVDAQVDTSLSWQGRWVHLQNRGDGGRGFYDTPLGARLAQLGARWSELALPGATPEFRFHLCLAEPFETGPFDNAIRCLWPRARRM